MFCVMLYFYAQNLMGGGDVEDIDSRLPVVRLLFVRSRSRFCSWLLRRYTSLRPSSVGRRSNKLAGQVHPVGTFCCGA